MFLRRSQTARPIRLQGSLRQKPWPGRGGSGGWRSDDLPDAHPGSARLFDNVMASRNDGEVRWRGRGSPSSPLRRPGFHAWP